jgi:hypothetical protein
MITTQLDKDLDGLRDQAAVLQLIEGGRFRPGLGRDHAHDGINENGMMLRR